MSEHGVEVRFPAVGGRKIDGRIIRWYVAEGEHIEQGSALFDYETSKLTSFGVAPASGTLHIVAAEGTEVKFDTLIAEILPA